MGQRFGIVWTMTPAPKRHPVGEKVENGLETVLFAGRWLLAPLYLGLLAGLVVVVIIFFREVAHMLSGATTSSAEVVSVQVLDLIDLALLGNLIVMVILAGFENFVSRIHAADSSPDKPRWMGKVDFSGLKLKLIGSLVAISAIQLLKDFLRLDQIHDFTPIGWQIGIHMTFVVSGVLFAVTDWIGAKSHLIDHEVDEGDDS